MPQGLKQSSSVVPIGFSLVESAANTFTQSSVDLNLSPLDREVFVVLAINLDNDFPEGIAATNTSVRSAVTTTSQTSMPTLGNANCLARTTDAIMAAGFTDYGAAFQQQALETPPSTLEYIGIIATNDFFIQVQGGGNANPHGCAGKLYGYRARVTDASIYAALVQSEILSA
jgi:hypothetical protein